MKYKDINYGTRGMTEEEYEAYLDEQARPKKQNQRKSMASLYTYLVLKKHSDSDNHLTQEQILKYLQTEFEIEIRRGALSRCLHGLEDDDLGITSARGQGFWYNEEDDAAV